MLTEFQEANNNLTNAEATAAGSSGIVEQRNCYRTTACQTWCPLACPSKVQTSSSYAALYR